MATTHELRQKDFFDRKAKDYATDSDNSWVLLHGINSFLDFLALPGPQNILEVGCGYGRWTMHLLRRGHRVTAVDISEDSFKALHEQAERENLTDRITPINSNFENVLFEEVFDGAFFGNVIHHFDPAKKEKLFANIVRAVKNGGWVASIEPNPYNPLFYPCYFIKGLWDVEKGFLSCSLPKLIKLYRDNHLTSLKIESYGLFPNRWGKVCKFIIPLNGCLNKVPLVKKLAVFNYLKGIKQPDESG